MSGGKNQSKGDAMQISTDDIAALAYELWQERGCPEGSPEEDWYRAEQELKTGERALAAIA